MSQFELENAIREATRMDSSINNKGVSWNKPRKALENTNTSFNISKFLSSFHSRLEIIDLTRMNKISSVLTVN